MKFKLNTEELHKNLFTGEAIRHKTGKKIKIFPFTANAKALIDEQVIADLKDFKGIAGACFRESMGLIQEGGFNKSDFIELVCAKAGAAGDINLKNILENVAFNDQKQLVLFDALVYPHIRNAKDNTTLDGIAKYLVALFFDQNEKSELERLVNKKSDNLLYKLILSCLPDQLAGEPEPEVYLQTSTVTKSLFQQDLKTLLSDPELFISGFHQLLKFYLFKYISDLVIDLNSFFCESKDKLFFSVKWEKLQDFRLAMTNGWQMFEKHMDPMFSHAVNLELINHIDGFENGPVTYHQIKSQLVELNETDRQSLLDALDELTIEYKEAIKDVSWSKFGLSISRSEMDPVERKIITLFQMIEFQFKETKRERAKQAYQQWMCDFTNFNFTRRRGRLGFSLSLDHELLLLLTRLCVGDRDRIRLNQLWDELQRRGIRFDNVSKEHVINYFEKVNLLEKKSDSGDAQYISKFNQTLV